MWRRVEGGGERENPSTQVWFICLISWAVFPCLHSLAVPTDHKMVTDFRLPSHPRLTEQATLAGPGKAFCSLDYGMEGCMGYSYRAQSGASAAPGTVWMCGNVGENHSAFSTQKDGWLYMSMGGCENLKTWKPSRAVKSRTLSINDQILKVKLFTIFTERAF